MIEELLAAMFVVLGVLNAWVTWRVVRDDLSTTVQRLAQVFFVWLVPFLGAFVVLRLQQKEPERGSGRYREIPDAGDDYAVSRQSFRRSQEAIEGNSSSAPPDGSPDP